MEMGWVSTRYDGNADATVVIYYSANLPYLSNLCEALFTLVNEKLRPVYQVSTNLHTHTHSTTTDIQPVIATGEVQLHPSITIHKHTDYHS